MKKNIAKSILSWLLVFSMVIPSLSYAINTQAAEGDIKNYDAMSMKQLLASDESLTWVITGDSITHNGGWTAGLNSYGEWMEQYLDEYGRGDDSVVLTGWGGASTEDFQTVENTPDGAGTKQPGQEGQGIENFITKYNPDVVTIKLGMNDRYKTKAEFVTYYKQMLDSLYKICKDEYNKVPKVIILSPTPIASENLLDDKKHGYGEVVNGIYESTGEVADGVYESTTRQRNALEEIVEEYNTRETDTKNLLFCDLRTAFLKEAQALGENYVSTFFQDPSDGAIHPNGAGQYCIFKTLADTLGIYDSDEPIFQIEYEDLVYHSLYTDETAGVTYTGDYGYTSVQTEKDNTEMKGAMPTLNSEVRPLASVDFSEVNGNLVYNKNDVNASTIDLTEAQVGVNTLTVEELKTVDKEFSIVFRAKLNPNTSSTCQPIFYVSSTTNNTSIYTNTHSRVVLSVPGVNSHHQRYMIKNNGTNIANFEGTSFNYGDLYKDINDGQWHTIALVQSANNYTAYVDGNAYSVKMNNNDEIKVNSKIGDMFANITDDQLDAVVGRWGKTNTTDKTQGKFDYWQFYNKALTGDEIQQLSSEVGATPSWIDTLAENNTWAVAGGTQMAGYDGVVLNRSLMRYIENSVRGGGYDYRDIHMFNLASSGSDVVTLGTKYEKLKAERDYEVFLLLPEVNDRVYSKDYIVNQADLYEYKTAIENLIKLNEGKDIILWSPLASNDTTINSNIDEYAKEVRDIADANPNILFFDANRFMNDNMEKISSLSNNWFENEQYVSPLCTVDVARAFLEVMIVNVTGKGELIAHNLRYASDEKIFKGDYVRDNIAATASTEAKNVTVNVGAIRNAYPEATLSFKVLPHKTVENNNKNIVELSKVTNVNVSADDMEYTFEAPCADLNLAIYGEQDGLIYRFKDISLNVETDKTIQTATPDGVYLDSLKVMSAPDIKFSRDTKEYDVNLYQYQSHVTIRATAQAGLTIKINGEEVASGAESKAIAVNDNSSVTVEVSNGTDEEIYTLNMKRAEQPDIIITEVMTDGYWQFDTSGTGNDNYELVEIYNASGRDLNLKEYSIGYKKDYNYSNVNIGNGSELPYYFTGNNLLVGKETHTGIKKLTKYSMYWDGQEGQEPPEIEFKKDSTMVIWIKFSPQDAKEDRENYGKKLTYDTLIEALEQHKDSKTLSVDIDGESKAVVPTQNQMVVAEVDVDMKSGALASAAGVKAENSQKNWYLENTTRYDAIGQKARNWLFILNSSAETATNGKVTEAGNDIISAAKYVRAAKLISINTDGSDKEVKGTDKLSSVFSYNYERGMSLVKNESYLVHDMIGTGVTSDVMGYSNKTSFGAIEYWQKPTDFDDTALPTITDKTEKETTVGANLSIKLDLEDENDLRYVTVYARKAGDTEFTKYAKDFVLETSVKNEGVAADVKNATFTCTVENVTDTVEYYAEVVDGNNNAVTLGSAKEPLTINTLPKVIAEYPVADAKGYIGDDAPACKYEGYLFSGWYADAACKDTPIASDAEAEKHETVYALFVPEEVLGVKAQLIAHLENESATDDQTGTIRFVTSIDSKWYKEVGFNVSYDLNGDGIIQDGEKAKRSSNKAYSKLLYIGGTDGETMAYYPNQEFSSVSQYFKACTVKELSNDYFDLDFTVEPFWRTPDGIVVTGEPQVKRINDGIALKYEAKNDTKYYADLEEAVNEASEGSTVTVFKDAEVESAMTVNRNVTIQNRVGRNVTIYRGEGLATTNTFNVGTAGTLTIKGADDENSIVLDGRKKTDADTNVGRDAAVGSTGSLIGNSGTVELTNVTVQYVKKDVSGGDGGVINNASGASVVVTDSVFDNNYTTRFGSIVYNKGDMTFERTTFTNNKGGNGGVLCHHGGSLFEVKDSTFTNNSGNQGGAIWTDQAYTLNNCTFDTNKSTNAANQPGGAIRAAANGTITKCDFLNNVSSNAGGAIMIESGTETSISDCTFTNNESPTNGGAICTNVDTIIQNTEFTRNKAKGTGSNAGGVGGGAIFSSKVATITVKDCDFTSNAAGTTDSCGGAICIFQGTLVMTDASRSTFTSNTATHGGAICLGVSATGNIDYSDFTGNISNWPGGAIYAKGNLEIKNSKFERNKGGNNGGAIKLDSNKTGKITACEFIENTANHGGAIHEQDRSVTISGCKFERNAALSGDGGAINAQTGTDTIENNCTFTGNTATKTGAAIYFKNGTLNLKNSIFNNFAKTDIYINSDATIEEENNTKNAN